MRRERDPVKTVLAVDRIRQAIVVPGASPGVHREEIDRLARRWPTLAHALDDLLVADGRPPEFFR